MTEGVAGWHGRSLAGRLAGWVALCTVLSLCLFALIAYLVIRDEVGELHHQSPAEWAADSQHEIVSILALAAPVVLAISVAGIVLLTRRLLRPLEQVVRAAAGISARDLDRRLPLPTTNDEVTAVVLAFNQLLERLEAGFAALGRFATEASHELRTPLTVVSAELEVMLRHPRSAREWEASARTCLDEVRHLTQLVEALLEMSRAKGEQPGELVELDEIIEHVVGQLASRAMQRRVRLSWRRAASTVSGTVKGQRTALTSALFNIVDNAIRYTAAASEVSLELLAPDKATVLLRVDDAGPGVDVADIEAIFEPFKRGSAGRAADAAAPDQRGGSGLGLAISREILDLHSASIEVERSPAGGARFQVTFPLAKDRSPGRTTRHS